MGEIRTAREIEGMSYEEFMLYTEQNTIADTEMGKPVVDYWTKDREVTATVYVDEDKVDWGYEYWLDKEFMGKLQQEIVKAHRKAEDEGYY